ncbi:MAG TPA: heavy metal-associated domain-containing protein [Bryobacteraceae bacterium]|jgi:Cu+-exporting ATPase|nr:heavy metal-associated domain-containing protein [Bryobacteraceae bacterium]
MNVFRRRFLQSISATAGSIALAAEQEHRQKEILVWRVTGFTCVTCAVGLDTLLGRKPGVLAAHSKYPEGIVRIEYDPARISCDELKQAIQEMGFRVEPQA